MGQQVAFWSNRHGQTANSSNMIAVSALIGMEYSTRTMLSHTQWGMSPLESIFEKNSTITVNDSQYVSGGIDALERLARSNQLTSSIVNDYVDPILKDRLYLLRGTTSPSENLYNSILDVLPTIFKTANSYYDLSLIDVNSGIRNPLTKSVISISDVVVISLNQNSNVLDEFFNETLPNFLEDKKLLIVLGQYDKSSKYTVGNIKRMYKTKLPIYTVPKCTGFMDALNDKSVIEFFFRNKNIRSHHENYLFLSEIRKFAKGILDAAGVDSKLYSEQGA